MGQLPDLRRARARLGLALDSLCHDRWLLGYLRGGGLQPIAASEISRRLLRSRPLMPLSRRALYERRPVVVNSVIESGQPSNGYDWELDWPAILYAPVIEPMRRPIGLLVIGCRRDHWYSDDDVEYAGRLGITLAPLVTALRGVLSGLSEGEAEVAQLMSYGFSMQEVARATQLDERRARYLVDCVSRKLESVSTGELGFPIGQMKRRELRM